MFFHDMLRNYPLAYLQKLSVPYLINWSVTRKQDRVAVGNFGTIKAYQDVLEDSLPGFFLADSTRTIPLVKFHEEPTLF